MYIHTHYYCDARFFSYRKEFIVNVSKKWTTVIPSVKVKKIYTKPCYHAIYW